MVAYIRDSWSYTNSVGTEACVYASGPCCSVSFESRCLGNQRYSTAVFGHYFVFVTDVHDVNYATQTDSCVKSKLKLGLKNTVTATEDFDFCISYL